MVEIYTTSTCPRCKILKDKLQAKNVEYKENQNVEEMARLGIEEVPKLMVDGSLLGFGDAVAWVNKL